jgi:hypothetical protein
MRIAAKIWRRRMALFANQVKPNPQDAFLRHLDQAALWITCIRHNNPIMGVKEVWPFVQKELQAIVAAGFFIGYDRQSQILLGYN